MTMLLPALSGCNALYGLGMLELGMTFSLEQLVLDNDMAEMTKYAMRGIDVSDLTLGVESIRKVGIGNNFLAHKQTREYIDVVSDPRLFNRDMYGDWEAAGSKDIVTVAHEVVVDVLKNHEVTPIDADLVKDMKAVVDKADEAFRATM